jgi:inner membrane protein
MFVAHIPAGYLLTTSLLQRCRALTTTQARWVFCLGLFAAALPDLDLLYFHLIDHRRHNHHSYWTHIPFYWLILMLFMNSLAAVKRHPLLRWACFIVFCNVLLHCLLDSVASGIQWLYPLSGHYIALLPLHGDGGWPLAPVIVCCAFLELTIVGFALRRLLQARRTLTGKTGR